MNQPNKPFEFPYYLEEAMADLESAFALKADLREVFTVYFLSEEHITLTSKARKWAYFELYNSLTTLLEHYIMQRLGPLPDQPTLPLPASEEDSLQTGMLPQFTANPHLCEDVLKLREWVFFLQESGRIQEKRIECQEQLIATEAQMRYIQQQQIAALKGLNERLTRLQTDTTARLN
ncbi:hypothetical protein G8759_06200 [Spirosoma aureum]|uniref:Uncharacterized protein n=1 Tax=Spirosoma aureum TaxID=2692134 RepID=A0A6G9AIH6_9BACT|nr:hypothetical protein [Spirosoma aureum]QIP12248.1 hypothetical protein G8759_06200 [Spirosoma aureum]